MDLPVIDAFVELVPLGSSFWTAQAKKACNCTQKHAYGRLMRLWLHGRVGRVRRAGYGPAQWYRRAGAETGSAQWYRTGAGGKELELLSDSALERIKEELSKRQLRSPAAHVLYRV